MGTKLNKAVKKCLRFLDPNNEEFRDEKDCRDVDGTAVGARYIEKVVQKLVAFFDLDGTLFDHYHSLRLAIASIQRNYNELKEKNIDELIDKYNLALQQAYDAYLDKVIAYEQADVQKIHLFFSSLGLPEPSLDEVQKFRGTYKAVYRKNRRATPGSIEALARLREHGYRIAIITNGQVEDQTAKAKAIGIHHLIDRIITSEEAGYRKPDRRIFQYAIEQLGASPDTACLIGDSADSDIKGALDAQMVAIMYSPTAPELPKAPVWATNTNHTTHDPTPRLFGHRRPLSSAAFCLHSGPADDREH